jgi:predicted nucleic acid-binding protein
MSASSVFVDTNILIYSYDKNAGDKHRMCKNLVKSCWNAEPIPFISIQVIQEFFVNVYKKSHDLPLSIQLAADYLSWNVVENNTSLLMESFAIMKRYQTSYWDSAIIAAANRSNVDELWTEDLNSGQMYGTVRAINPISKDS